MKTGKLIKKYTLVAFFVVMMAVSQTLCMKADIGLCACWDSVSLNVYQITGLKVGTFSIIGNFICILIQILMLRKDFHPVRLLQIPVAVIFGVVVNFVYYKVLLFELHGYPVRVLFWAVSYLGLAVFIGGLNLLGAVQIPVESTYYTASSKFGIDFAKLHITCDALLIITSLSLSLLFGLSFKVREGTIGGMLVLGPLTKWCMGWEKKIIQNNE